MLYLGQLSSDYPDSFLDMPRYCCLVKIFVFLGLLRICLKFRAACYDGQAEESAVKCSFQEHNRMACVGLKQNHADYVCHHYSALTTSGMLSTVRRSLSFGKVSTPGQTQTGLGLRVYPFITSDCCTTCCAA